MHTKSDSIKGTVVLWQTKNEFIDGEKTGKEF